MYLPDIQIGKSLKLSKNVSNWLKVFSAILIMLTHYSGYATTRPELSNCIFKALAGGIKYIGPVSIFFFLSGYGLMESTKEKTPLIHQFNKRILKVLLPVLLVFLIWIPIAYKLRLVHDTTNFLINIGDGVLWFIKSLILLYVCFYIFKFVNRKNRFWSWIIYFLLCTTVYYLTDKFIAPFASYTVYMFYVGSLVSLVKNRYWRKIPLPVIVFVIAGILGLLLHGRIIFLSNLLFLSLLVLIPSYVKRDIKCPVILATMSFDVYLVHYKFILYATAYEDYTLSLMGFFIGTILVSYILTKSRSPIEKWLFEKSCLK